VISDTHINNLLDAISAQSCEKSYKELFMLMHDKLVHFAQSILKSTEDAEEVVSDLFINIWQKRVGLKTLEKPKLYFFVSVKNAAINKIRANKRQQPPPLEQWLVKSESVFFNPEELMLSEEFTKRIMTCVNDLPPKCRLVFKLIKEDGLKYTEVAQLLEISIKTVEAQMAIAIRRLKDSLEFKNAFPEIHSILTPPKK
jgi:RNA polymerase sigma-70 factor (family 1)